MPENTADILSRLQMAAADDYEFDVLASLARRAGVLWLCDQCVPGGWDNREEETACGRCGAPKPDDEDEEPQTDIVRLTVDVKVPAGTDPQFVATALNSALDEGETGLDWGEWGVGALLVTEPE